jgi:hypothetical protein
MPHLAAEQVDYLAACTRDVLHADDQGSFDDDGSREDGSVLPCGDTLTAQVSGRR